MPQEGCPILTLFRRCWLLAEAEGRRRGTSVWRFLCFIRAGGLLRSPFSQHSGSGRCRALKTAIPNPPPRVLGGMCRIRAPNPPTARRRSQEDPLRPRAGGQPCGSSGTPFRGKRAKFVWHVPGWKHRWCTGAAPGGGPRTGVQGGAALLARGSQQRQRRCPSCSCRDHGTGRLQGLLLFLHRHLLLAEATVPPAAPGTGLGQGCPFRG